MYSTFEIYSKPSPVLGNYSTNKTNEQKKKIIMCGIEPSYYGTHAPTEHTIASTPSMLRGSNSCLSSRHVILHMIASRIPSKLWDWRLDHISIPEARQNNAMVLPFSQAIAHSRAKLKTGSNEK
jgi:hypothetical protein